MNNLKFKLIVSILVLFSTIALSSDSIIQYFSAESNGDSVTVKWTTNTEDNLRRFELERSLASGAFVKIYTQNAKGTSSSYSYTDTEAFMKQNDTPDDGLMSQNTYSYRIKVIYSDNTHTYTESTLIKHKPSSIRRTWGMIKEMFR